MDFTFHKPARPVSRVFLHCSASDNPDHDSAAVIDSWHKAQGWAGIGYHVFIRKDGTLEKGRDLEKVPAAQSGHNTRSIAICLHGLAKDRFTEAQFTSLRALCAQINDAYGGKVTFHGHREVANKTCPVFDYRQVLGLDRNGQLGAHDHGPLPATPDNDPQVKETLRVGAKGWRVTELQEGLADLGYFTGGIDGIFGTLTRAAVLAFQADNHLETDGVVGALTWEALLDGIPRQLSPERVGMSMSELAAKGDTVVRTARSNVAVGGLLASGGLATLIGQIGDQADMIRTLIEDHGLVVGGVALAIGVFVAVQSWRSGRDYLSGFRAGKNI